MHDFMEFNLENKKFFDRFSDGDKKKSDGGYRVNREITAQTVRLIDENGEPVGVVNVREAMTRAREAGLDLVEVAPTANPPVCKIANYGKLKYELQKKKAEAKKKQKVIEIKEVKLTPAIGEHDYQVKLGKVKSFIEDGNKVKITLRFRGRELSHKELGVALINRLLDDVKSVAKCDVKPKLEDRQMMAMLSPMSAKQ